MAGKIDSKNAIDAIGMLEQRLIALKKQKAPQKIIVACKRAIEILKQNLPPQI